MRTPVPLIRASPATETSTRSHQDPRGTVSRPLTMVALSWASSQVTLAWDGMSTAACSANCPAESASPTYTARRPPATCHCWSAADQNWNWRRGTSTLTHRDSPGASVTRANCDSCRTANCTPAGGWLGAPRYTCGTAAPVVGPVLRDLSIGYTAGVGAFVIAELIAGPVNLPWWLGIIGGLAVCGLIGFVQGSLVTRLNLPSFIVTLAGYLGLLGVMLELAQIDKTAVGASSRSIRAARSTSS